MGSASLGASARWGGVLQTQPGSLALPKDAELCDCSCHQGMLHGTLAPWTLGSIEIQGPAPCQSWVLDSHPLIHRLVLNHRQVLPPLHPFEGAEKGPARWVVCY